MREINFLRSCNHPAIMRVFDEGLYLDEHPFVVMEYLPIPLSKVVPDPFKTHSPRPQTIGFALQLLSALDYLEKADPPVVHRDLKPANVFVQADSAVLGDFGLMKHWMQDREADLEFLKREREPEMPQRYRTPDLVRYYTGGEPPTPKSDVYQLGLVLSELFTGANPQVPAPFNAPVVLRALLSIGGPYGESIESLLERMLVEETKSRPSAADLIPARKDVFLDAIRRELSAEE